MRDLVADSDDLVCLAEQPLLADLGFPKSLRIRVPSWAFSPNDHWTAMMLEAIRQKAAQDVSGGLHGQRIWEVGVGTGVPSLYVSCLVQASKVYFSDLDPRCTELAEENVAFASPMNIRKPLRGSWKLCTPPEGQQAPSKIGWMIACLPQMVAPPEVDLHVGDNLANYYDPREYPDSLFNDCGLGLIEAFLLQARGVLVPGGKVMMTIAGRPGLRVDDLFRACNYQRPVAIISRLVAQHRTTGLGALVAFERQSGNECEFFGDEQGIYQFGAEEAEARRRAGGSLYHRLSVFESSPIGE